MRILFLAARELEYPRNDVMLRALRRIGQVEVLAERGPGSILVRSVRLGLRGLGRVRSSNYDLIYIGFFGHLLSAALGAARRAPLLFDAFVSAYDTLVEDRARFAPGSPGARLAYFLDRAAVRHADHILLDTELHSLYFQNLLRLPPDCLTAVPVGCNEELFRPQPPPTNQPVSVLYYCSFLPLHGVETVLRAADLLRDTPGLRFRLIGDGPERARAGRLSDELGLPNVEFLAPVPVHQLPREVSAAQICLGGHFGLSPKAGRVVPGKIYQMLAMARPVIAGDTPANRSVLAEGEEALFSPPADPERLAEAIHQLHRQPDLRRRLSAGGRARYEACCSEELITARLADLAHRLIAAAPPPAA